MANIEIIKKNILISGIGDVQMLAVDECDKIMAVCESSIGWVEYGVKKPMVIDTY